jgi:hypothetical protein
VALPLPFPFPIFGHGDCLLFMQRAFGVGWIAAPGEMGILVVNKKHGIVAK